MSEQQMREALKKAYPNPTWRTKVDKMSGPQVYAVYNSMKNEGRL